MEREEKRKQLARRQIELREQEREAKKQVKQLAGINDDNIDLMNSDDEVQVRTNSVLSDLEVAKQNRLSTPQMQRSRQNINQTNDGCECTLF